MEYSEFKFDETLSKCPACDSAEVGVYLYSVDDDYGVEGFCNSKCDNCGTIFTNPRPTKASLDNFYDELPDSNEKFLSASLNYYLNPERKKQMYENYLKPLLEYRKSGKLLDFGAGTGWFMKLAEDNGFEVSGIEYVRKAVEAGRQRFGLTGLVQGCEDSLPKQMTYDLIIANNNIEHLREPYSFTKKAFGALQENGLLVVTYPCADSYMFKILEKYSYYFMNPYHLTHFTKKGIEVLLERAGFTKISFELQRESYYWSHGICHKNGLLHKYKKWREDPDFVKYDIFMDEILADLAYRIGETSNKMVFATKRA